MLNVRMVTTTGTLRRHILSCFRWIAMLDGFRALKLISRKWWEWHISGNGGWVLGAGGRHGGQPRPIRPTAHRPQFGEVPRICFCELVLFMPPPNTSPLLVQILALPTCEDT